MATRFLIGLGMTAMLLGVFPASAPAQMGLGQRLGKELDDALGNVSKQLKESWAKAETLVDRLGVRGRVYARMHWDKTLHSQSINIDVVDSNVVVLTGRVKDETAHEKAVRLAEDTLGVSKVTDRLEVAPSRGAAR